MTDISEQQEAVNTALVSPDNTLKGASREHKFTSSNEKMATERAEENFEFSFVNNELNSNLGREDGQGKILEKASTLILDQKQEGDSKIQSNIDSHAKGIPIKDMKFNTTGENLSTSERMTDHSISFRRRAPMNMNDQTLERQQIVKDLLGQTDNIIAECSLQRLGIESVPEPRANKPFYSVNEGQSAKAIIQNESRFLDNMEKQRFMRLRQTAKSSIGFRQKLSVPLDQQWAHNARQEHIRHGSFYGGSTKPGSNSIPSNSMTKSNGFVHGPTQAKSRMTLKQRKTNTNHYANTSQQFQTHQGRGPIAASQTAGFNQIGAIDNTLRFGDGIEFDSFDLRNAQIAELEKNATAIDWETSQQSLQQLQRGVDTNTTSKKKTIFAMKRASAQLNGRGMAESIYTDASGTQLGTLEAEQEEERPSSKRQGKYLQRRMAAKGKRQLSQQMVRRPRHSPDMIVENRSDGMLYFSDKVATSHKTQYHPSATASADGGARLNLTQTIPTKTPAMTSFNAAHQVIVRPVHVRDTYSNKLLYPPKDETPVTFATVGADDPSIPLKGPPKKQESAVIFQMEKELAKLRERQLQDQMVYEENVDTITVDERFQQALGYFKLFEDALWKMPQAKSVIKEIKDSVRSLFTAKDNLYTNYVRGVEGQFELFRDKLEEQQRFLKQIGEHVQREQEHRDKVFDKFKNNGRRAREMLAAFENEIALDLEGADPQALRLLVDSNVSPELKQVASALSENQLNLEAFNAIIGQKEFPADMSLIDDVAQEQKGLRRKVAVETAKRVLRKFYNAVDRVDAGAQTEIDQIEYLRKFYDSQIDSLFEQIDKLKKQAAGLQKATDQAKASLAHEQKTCGDLRTQAGGLRAELEEEQHATKDLRESALNLEYQLRRMRQDMEHLVTKVADRDQKIVEDARLISSQRQDNKELQRTLEETRRDLEKLQKTFDKQTAKLESLTADYKELQQKYQDQMKIINDLNKQGDSLRNKLTASQKAVTVQKNVTNVNIKSNDNAIAFDVLSDEELAWVMLGLGATEPEVSYRDKDKGKIMKDLALWKKKLVEKNKDREGHLDMLKVALWDSYIARVKKLQKAKVEKVVRGFWDIEKRHTDAPALRKQTGKFKREVTKPEPKKAATRKVVPIAVTESKTETERETVIDSPMQQVIHEPNSPLAPSGIESVDEDEAGEKSGSSQKWEAGQASVDHLSSLNSLATDKTSEMVTDKSSEQIPKINEPLKTVLTTVPKTVPIDGTCQHCKRGPEITAEPGKPQSAISEADLKVVRELENFIAGRQSGVFPSVMADLQRRVEEWDQPPPVRRGTIGNFTQLNLRRGTIRKIGEIPVIGMNDGGPEQGRLYVNGVRVNSEEKLAAETQMNSTMRQSVDKKPELPTLMTQDHSNAASDAGSGQDSKETLKDAARRQVTLGVTTHVGQPGLQVRQTLRQTAAHERAGEGKEHLTAEYGADTESEGKKAKCVWHSEHIPACINCREASGPKVSQFAKQAVDNQLGREYTPLLAGRRRLLDAPNARSASPQAGKKVAAAAIAVQTDDTEYADIPLALEQKVEALMRRRLASLLGVRVYAGGDQYGASANVTQARLAGDGGDNHQLQLTQQASSSYVRWKKAPTLVGNVPNVRRMTTFMPVLGGKRRGSIDNEGEKECISHRRDPLQAREHIVNIMELQELDASIENARFSTAPFASPGADIKGSPPESIAKTKRLRPESMELSSMSSLRHVSTVENVGRDVSKDHNW